MMDSISIFCLFFIATTVAVEYGSWRQPQPYPHRNFRPYQPNGPRPHQPNGPHRKPPPRTPQTKPNIIFFIGDDIGFNDVGWRNANMSTNFMNELAKNGVILDNYYTFALCTPSRTSVMTGYYAQTLGLQRGVLMNQEPYGIPLRYRLVSARLKEANYSTHAIGKWHLGYCDWRYTPTYRGFDSFLGFYNGGMENYLHCVSRNYIFTRENCTGVDFRINKKVGHLFHGQYSTDVFTKRAVDVIMSHHKKNPLYMYMSLTDTHFPLQPPKRFLDRCNHIRHAARRRFCGAMVSIDESMRRVTDALKQRRMYENSIIIFVSDNGGSTRFGANNYPLRGEKGTIWEGGTRVPGFVHSPLLQKKRYVNRRLIHAADWHPTILRLAGLKPDEGVEGVDQWNSISKDEPTLRVTLPYAMDITDNGTLIAAVRDERYKLIAGPGGLKDQIVPEWQTVDNSFNATFMLTYVRDDIPFNLNDVSPKLYDLENDPSETRNLALEMPNKVRELQAVLNDYHRKSKPAVKIPDDPAGDPEKFNYTYTPGWCIPFYDVPSQSTPFTNHYIYSIM